jgi:GNAT superfamily N-acetyltransferase
VQPAGRVVNLAHADAEDVFLQAARLHVAGIHHGALPLLGERFVAKLYRELAHAPSAGVWGVIDADGLVGFVAGSVDLRRTYRELLTRGWRRLSVPALRGLVKPAFLRRVASLVRYPFSTACAVDGGDSAPSAIAEPEILALAVAESARRRGIAGRLVSAFEAEMLARGRHGHYRVTTNCAELVSNAFYRKAGFVPSGTLRHHDLTLQIYRKPLPTADRRASA